MRYDVTIGNDILHVSDIIARLEELHEQSLQLQADINNMEADPSVGQSALDDAYDALDEFEYETDYTKLVELLDEVKRVGPHYRDAALVHESYFEDHARQEALDGGFIEDDTAWPAVCIDWKQAAEMLKADYMEVRIGDDTYFVRH